MYRCFKVVRPASLETPVVRNRNLAEKHDLNLLLMI